MVAMLNKLLALALLVSSTLAASSSFKVEIRPRQNTNTSQYPPALTLVDKEHVPKEWLDALNAAISAGKIPNIPVAQYDANTGAITYPGNAANDPNTCSWTATKCFGPNEIHTAPDGHIAVGFDDGPTVNSDDLYDFLDQQKQSATHFMIGSNVLANSAQFKHAVALGNQHFAVHTWSHHVMTSLTNEQVVGELGWTMQIIADMSGGYIPRYWRPPQGDIDNRVRAIAENVFGLTSVIWNQDTDDWCLQDDGTSVCPDHTVASIEASVDPMINGPKSPGLIILEHELTHASINLFKTYYPKLKGLGWIAQNVPDLFGAEWYKNAKSDAEKPDQRTLLGPYQNATTPASGSSSAASSTSTSSSSTSSSPSSTSSASAKSANSTPSVSIAKSANGTSSAPSSSKAKSQSSGATAPAIGLSLVSLAVAGSTVALFL